MNKTSAARGGVICSSASSGGEVAKKKMAGVVTTFQPLIHSASPHIGCRISRSDLGRKWRVGASSAAPGIDLKPLEAAIKKVDSHFQIF